MKATLEFNLPEEKVEYQFATQGADWYTVLWNLDSELRDCIKYEQSLGGAHVDHRTVDAVRDRLFEILIEFNLTLE